MGLCGSAPSAPRPNVEAREAIYTDISLLPFRRQIEAASALGRPVTVDGKTYDFTGLGGPEYQEQYIDQMARALLDYQRDYGSQFIEQRLAELERSDPEGQAARRQLYSDIISQIGEAPERPSAEELQASVLSELQKGGELGPEIERQIMNTVRGQQSARGNIYGSANVAQEARALGGASEALKSERQRRAIDFLVSGTTPEDVQYRRNQQNMANIGAFLGGETPLAQFGQLSGAQNQAAPFYGGPQMSGVDPNAASKGLNFASNIYGSQQNLYLNSVNPWIAGLGGGLSGLTTAANLGWNPFGNRPTGQNQTP